MAVEMTYMTLVLMSVIAVLPNAQYYNCSDQTCQNQHIYCQLTNCTVDCTGDTACVSATIYAANSNAVVNCNANDACGSIKIYANTAESLIVTGTNDYCLSDSEIHCPQNNYCNITVNGDGGLDSAIINGTLGSKLFIKAYGEWVLNYARIYCPPDTESGPIYTNNAACNIYAKGPMPVDSLTIYANEGFNNVKAQCIGTGYYGKMFGVCYDIHEGLQPSLYCGVSLETPCRLDMKINDLICDSPTHICNGILASRNPTTSPTLKPTTEFPTFSPTKYDPQKESVHTLYVSNHGCDCSICNGISIASTPTIIPSDCNQYNTLIINEIGTMTQSIISTNQTEVLCFQVQSSFECFNPSVEQIVYEDISYFGNNAYLNIGYQTKSNRINPYYCGRDEECGQFYNCSVLTDPLDVAWTFDRGPYAFYIMNGKGVFPLCNNPTRSMNVQLSVSCSSFPYVSTCETFSYSWECLKGKDICNNSEYDGNGQIKMDIGYYTFNNSIYIKNKQIRIEGSGINKTIFHHSSNNYILISCYFRQCYLTISHLSYNISTLSYPTLITASDYGH
eukprot:513173_1